MSGAPLPSDPEAWNRAHRRLLGYLEGFALADSRRTARLALAILDEAQAEQAADPSGDPASVTLGLAQRRVAEWLAACVDREGKPPAEVAGAGGLALLLSGIPERDPEAFLAPPPEAVRQAMRDPLLVVGPDLALSSMTSRRLDYGPMRGFANQTWHRWDPRELVVAVLFWAAVFFILYRWIPDWL